ncbi:MAG TPA: class I SAM-dependent methyltransferase [Candidatus Binatia bacterium]|jgi:SAM-dependent methyltransferase
MTNFFDQLDAVILPHVARQPLADWISGTISAPIVLLTLMNLLQEPQRVSAALEPLLEQIRVFGNPREQEKAAQMDRLLARLPSALENIGALLEMERDHGRSCSGDPVARCAALFDTLVKQSEEASVALYSLGDAALLQSVTAEVVNQLERWNFLGADRVVLQIGCGIGRFEAALAGSVKIAYGIDISTEMIAAARRRCAACQNVSFALCSGHDLSLFAAEMFDGVYAVDTFPYLYAAGSHVVARHFREIARVLRPRGDFILMNFSYRGSPQTDRLDVEKLAQQYDFEILANGIQPFEIWDGAVWRLRLRSSAKTNDKRMLIKLTEN